MAAFGPCAELPVAASASLVSWAVRSAVQSPPWAVAGGSVLTPEEEGLSEGVRASCAPHTLVLTEKPPSATAGHVWCSFGPEMCCLQGSSQVPPDPAQSSRGAEQVGWRAM